MIDIEKREQKEQEKAKTRQRMQAYRRWFWGITESFRVPYSNGFTEGKNNKIGIPIIITNYFCGNKSVFAVLNSHQRTSSTISVVCLAKTVPQDGDFFTAKMLRTEKSAFLDDFSRA